MPRTNFRYLNTEGRWLGWSLHNVAIDASGVASLVPLPLGATTRRAGRSVTFDGAAGAAFVDGALWFTDPASGTLSRSDPCGGSPAEPPCDPPELSRPRGLAPAREPGLVWLADAGRDQVLLLRQDGSLVQAIGRPSPVPGPDAEPGTLSDPWAVAVDGRGALYVADHGNGRVQKFSPAGQVRTAFWRRMHETGLVTRPAAVAVHEGRDSRRIFVLDLDRSAILVFDETGDPSDEGGGAFGAGILKDPLALCVSDDLLLVGDNGTRSILAFRIDGTAPLLGEVSGYAGPVAALGRAPDGTVSVHPGDGPPVTLAGLGGYAAGGWMVSPRISAGGTNTVWHRVTATLQAAGEHGSFQLFVRTSADPAEVAADMTSGPSLPGAGWRPVGPDADAGFIDSRPGAPHLWIAVRLDGDGASSPRLSQIKVEHDHLGYLPLLPAIYRESLDRPANPDDFLLRFLSLFETFENDAATAIEALDGLFTDERAPREALPWLAALLGVPAEEDWTESRLRLALRGASGADSRRGTEPGLRAALAASLGTGATSVDDGEASAGLWIAPDRQGGCHADADGEWQGGDDARLGFTTFLASAEPYGAVLDVSATLDASHLIDEQDLFAPVLGDATGRIVMRMPEAALAGNRRDIVRRLAAGEVPAHVAVELAPLRARTRLGLAILGQETILGGPPPPEPVGGTTLVLGGPPRGQLGTTLQLGRAATL